MFFVLIWEKNIRKIVSNTKYTRSWYVDGSHWSQSVTQRSLVEVTNIKYLLSLLSYQMSLVWRPYRCCHEHQTVLSQPKKSAVNLAGGRTLQVRFLPLIFFSRMLFTCARTSWSQLCEKSCLLMKLSSFRPLELPLVSITTSRFVVNICWLVESFWQM